MSDFGEKFKKVGASIIISLLAVMMLLMFGGLEMQEYTNLFSGGGTGNMGSFGGRAIDRNSYAMIQNGCQRRMEDAFRQFAQGGMQSFIDQQVQSCTSRELKAMYALDSIASRLGLEVSKSRIEKDLARAVDMAYQQNRQTALEEDDKLSKDALYRRELQSMPMETRLLQATYGEAYRSLGVDFPYPTAVADSADVADEIKLDVRYIRFANADLLARLDATVTVNEAEVRAAHDKEQAKLPEDKRKPFETQRKFVENRLRSELKQKALKDIKERLGKLGNDFSLDKITEITGIEAVTVVNISLRGLRNIKNPAGGSINLALPEFLQKLRSDAGVIRAGPMNEATPKAGPGATNPIEAAGYTVFAEASNIRVPATAPKPDTATADKKTPNLKKAAQDERMMANRMLEYLINRESNRQGFKLNVATDKERERR